MGELAWTQEIFEEMLKFETEMPGLVGITGDLPVGAANCSGISTLPDAADAPLLAFPLRILNRPLARAGASDVHVTRPLRVLCCGPLKGAPGEIPCSPIPANRSGISDEICRGEESSPAAIRGCDLSAVEYLIPPDLSLPLDAAGFVCDVCIELSSLTFFFGVDVMDGFGITRQGRGFSLISAPEPDVASPLGATGVSRSEPTSDIFRVVSGG